MLEKILKKWLVILTIVALVADVGIFLLVFKTGKTIKTFSDVGVPSVSENLGSGITLDKYTLAGRTSTTTPIGLSTTSASSTAELIMSVSNAKHIDLNIMYKASTTAAILNWTNYFSNDDGSNKNWFPETGYTATSNVLETEGPTELVHSWLPGATTTTAWVWKNIGVDPVASKYMKTRFWTTIANGDLYVEGISQSDVNN
jgi:hypothetical protein